MEYFSEYRRFIITFIVRVDRAKYLLRKEKLGRERYPPHFDPILKVVARTSQMHGTRSQHSVLPTLYSVGLKSRFALCRAAERFIASIYP